MVPVPGPSAILAALVGAGFPTVPFTFHGFVPRKKGLRRALLERIARSRATSVAFEAPDRLPSLLSDLGELAGVARQVVVAREMTKIHEEFFRGTMGEAARYYARATSPGRDHRRRIAVRASRVGGADRQSRCRGSGDGASGGGYDAQTERPEKCRAA